MPLSPAEGCLSVQTLPVEFRLPFRARYILDGHVSNRRQTISGVLHGSAVAPTLLLKHFNNLLFSAAKSIHCFLDDSTLFSSISLSQLTSVAELNVNGQAEALSM